tara:strand:+ start:120 stop:392 length:273 start_codon:yes stop_codon:yes gene_type:complete
MIEIKKQRNALRIEVWIFTVIRNTLFLDKYYTAEKESTRHRKYKNTLYYDRIMRRNNTIKEEEVPLSRDIKEEALNMYFDKVKCMKWNER